MSPESCREVLRRHTSPMQPLPTGVEPVLDKLPGLRAVLFDVYGTLVTSACGEVGTASEEGRADAAEDALAAVGLRASGRGGEVVAALHEAIRRSHASSRSQGVEHPEVDIVEIWRRLVAELREDTAAEIDFEQLAVEYEARTNPTWPMPDLRECLERLRRRGLRLGLVSNAQFFTPELFPALVGAGLAGLGFDAALSVYSYRHGEAKPGPRLYEIAAEALAGYGVATAETLYVGNDMLNDVYAAHGLGFKTALFAGDQRSYRPRTGDPRLAGVEPDLVVVDLLSLDACLA